MYRKSLRRPSNTLWKFRRAYPVLRLTVWQFSDDPVEALGDRGREVAEQQTEDVMMHNTLTRRFNLQHPIFAGPPVILSSL
jgi:hypothetical protein